MKKGKEEKESKKEKESKEGGPPSVSVVQIPITGLVANV